MRSLEHFADIPKIEAVLFEIGKTFSFVPFKPHN